MNIDEWATGVQTVSFYADDYRPVYLEHITMLMALGDADAIQEHKDNWETDNERHDVCLIVFSNILRVSPRISQTYLFGFRYCFY